MTDTFLERRAIEAGYGASQLLFGIALRIRSGQVVLILGRNGMSKSMTLKTLVGSLVLLAGFKPDAIAHPDMALAPEILVCFADNRNQSGDSWTMDRIYTVFPKLKERVNNLGNQLAGGEQQMLAIGRALSANPRLLILDKATDGLAFVMREKIWRCLASLKAKGQTILVVDQYVHKLVGLASHHVILERGRVVRSDDSAALNADRRLRTDYEGFEAVLEDKRPFLGLKSGYKPIDTCASSY